MDNKYLKQKVDKMLKDYKNHTDDFIFPFLIYSPLDLSGKDKLKYYSDELILKNINWYKGLNLNIEGDVILYIFEDVLERRRINKILKIKEKINGSM